MKKLLVLLLTLATVLTLASCDVQGTINKILGKEEHVHAYEMISTDATCLDGGMATFACDCGDSYSEEIEALGHSYFVFNYIAPKCTKSGSTVYKCSRCNDRYSEKIEKTGHIWEQGVEASRLVCCTAEGCSEVMLAESNGKYAEALMFKYSDEDKAKFAEKIAALAAEIEAADDYDSSLHAFAETGALAEEYAAFDTRHTEVYDLLLYAMAQRQIAEIVYYCNMDDADAKATYDDMAEYYTGIVGEFYALSEPIYLSKYREFYYQGMTEEEIIAYLAQSGNYSDEDYIALKNANEQLESDYLTITNPESSGNVLEIYSQFVENNKAIAELMGYDNYVEYAYECVYERDYVYTDVDNIIEYVKKYLAPTYVDVYERWNSLVAAANSGSITNAEIMEYYGQSSYSFFEKMAGNKTLNDYIDLLVINEGKENSVSFSDEFNNMVGNGNMFRGDYEGAFVTYIYSLELPIAYFGSGYDNAFTVAHEFGHYMNEVYNKSEYSQSYDLLEMHSQGNEMIYLSYLEPYMSENAYDLVKTYQLVNILYSVMAGATVDAFERAVYTGSYSGTYSASIMADGVISSGEYDTLYKGILIDFGIEDYFDASYWRYVTVMSPCYYISYAISAIGVMPLYFMAEEDFDASVDAYLKLFTYTDSYVGENYTEMTTAEVLCYAGLYSFTDEALYRYLSSKFA